MPGLIHFLRRASAGLSRIRRVLFFYDRNVVVTNIDGIVELSRADLERIIADERKLWRTHIGSTSWLSAGGRLFALKREGELVSFGWAMHSETFGVGEIGGVVALTSAVLWIWNCFTPVEHRGRGYYPALLMGIRRELGSPPTLIYCEARNFASRRGIEKAGFSPAFTITESRLLVICHQRIRRLYAGYRRA